MSMPSVPQLLIILAIIVLLFGTKKIPELARGLGSGIKNFKKAVKDDESEENKEDEEDEIQDEEEIEVPVKKKTVKSKPKVTTNTTTKTTTKTAKKLLTSPDETSQINKKTKSTKGSKITGKSSTKPRGKKKIEEVEAEIIEEGR